MKKVKSSETTKASTTAGPSVVTLLNALPDPVVCFDQALGIAYSNHAAQTFFRLSEKKMQEKGLAAALGEGNAVLEAAQMIVRKNMTLTLHDVSIKGTPVSSVTLTTVEPDAWYLMAIHPQPPVQLAHEWNEKTKQSLKSTQMLAQMLAHEIKNPLAGIRGAAQLLNKSELNAEDKELAHLIDRETSRIQGLVDKFNIFHEVPDSQYMDVNLHEVLNRVARIAQAEYGSDIEIEEVFDPSLPDIRGHFDHLVQAKLNLVKNAAEAFANRKGKISIRTFYDNAAGYHPDRHEKLPLCIEIEDNGQGISPDVLRSIFQPYFTTKANGQGLGLPIVSKIVDDHGGTIKVDSKPGKTIFRISLPMPPNPARK